MKKSHKKYLTFSIIFLIVLCVTVRIILGLTFKEDNNVDSFLNGSYVKYNGGKEAQRFFEEYVSLDGYRDVAFNYSDAEKSLSLYKFHTCFVVDVYYEEAAFHSVVANLLPKTDLKSSNPEDLEISLGSFAPTEVSMSERWDKKHGCGIMFDLDHFTVRYAFVYNCGEVDSHDIINWVDHIIHPNWNSEYKGELLEPVFDYDE